MIKSLRTVFLLGFLLYSEVTFSQPGNPNPPDAPITGIEYLIGLGGLLGIKRIFDSQKKIRDTK
jgi:hypothetical protein